MKVNADESKMMVLEGEERLVCEVIVNGMQLEHDSEFKYLGIVLDETGTYEAGEK